MEKNFLDQNLDDLNKTRGMDIGQGAQPATTAAQLRPAEQPQLRRHSRGYGGTVSLGCVYAQVAGGPANNPSMFFFLVFLANLQFILVDVPFLSFLSCFSDLRIFLILCQPSLSFFFPSYMFFVLRMHRLSNCSFLSVTYPHNIASCENIIYMCVV